MKKKLVVIIAMLLIVILSFGMISCGASAGNDFMYDAEYGDEAGSSESINKTDGVDYDTSGDNSKIIKTANITAETQKYSKATEDLKALIVAKGGNIANSSAKENASYRADGKTEKSANYTIKIPSDKFDEFISELSNIFNITNLSTQTEDVSESYFTLQARIETLNSKRAGLLKMLENVDINTDFTTWQKINSELTEIETQINIYNEQFNSLKNKVAYSTITLSVREVAEYTDTEEKGYGEQVSDAFKNSFNAVVEFFKGFLLVMIYVLPFLLILGAVVLIALGSVALLAYIIYFIIKKIIKKRKKKINSI